MVYPAGFVRMLPEDWIPAGFQSVEGWSPERRGPAANCKHPGQWLPHKKRRCTKLMRGNHPRQGRCRRWGCYSSAAGHVHPVAWQDLRKMVMKGVSASELKEQAIKEGMVAMGIQAANLP